jgi:hypothetical protein
LGSSFGTAPLPWRQDRHDTRSTESRSPDDLLCNLRVSDQRGSRLPGPGDAHAEARRRESAGFRGMGSGGSRRRMDRQRSGRALGVVCVCLVPAAA